MESVRCKRCPDTKDDPLNSSNEEKTELLKEKLFPAPPQADLNDVTGDFTIREQLDIPLEVSADLVANTIAKLPNGKAAGPMASQMSFSN